MTDIFKDRQLKYATAKMAKSEACIFFKILFWWQNTFDKLYLENGLFNFD